MGSTHYLLKQLRVQCCKAPCPHIKFTCRHCCWRRFPYLIYGLVLPSRACLARLWVGLALVQMTKGITDFLTVLPAQASTEQAKGKLPGMMPYFQVDFTFGTYPQPKPPAHCLAFEGRSYVYLVAEYP